MPFVLEQSKVVFVPETAAEVKTQAQRSLMGKAKLPQQAFRALIDIVGYRFNAMQSGVALMPRSLAMAVLMPIGGKFYNKLGPRLMVATGLAISAISFVQLAHMTVNGATTRAGDLFASGTVSGESPDSYGSLMELSWGGTKPVRLDDGASRFVVLSLRRKPGTAPASLQREADYEALLGREARLAKRQGGGS